MPIHGFVVIIKLLSLFRKLTYLFLLFLLLLAIAVTVTVFMSGDPDYQGELDRHTINDITGLNPIQVATVVQPKSVGDIVTAITTSTGPISIGGGRFSQGGQTARDGSLHLDMRQFDQVLSFSKEQRLITVQSGITWRKLQQFIDPHDLAVKIMQTYSNFTVGGSLSVNVHGRYIGHGPIISSVHSLKLVLVDGAVIEASPDSNEELFYAAIGGYGGIGVIAEVTLMLDENQKIERRTATMPSTAYREYFFDTIRENKNIIMHNGDIYPPDFDTVRDVSWFITEKPLTLEERLIPEDREYFWYPKLADFTAASSFGKTLREHVFDPVFYSKDRIVWRNWEASYDVRELGEGDRSEQTYVLQEYFIPVQNFDTFLPKMRTIFQTHDVDVLNVSIRHAFPDSGSYLAWAREEVFAFVVYYRQGATEEDMQSVQTWTQEMIDAILSEQGSYYLTYQPHATQAQFQQAYPGAEKYFSVKRVVDPENRLQNKLLGKYYPSRQQIKNTFLKTLEQYKKGEEQTLLTLPEWYLVFNPNEYADFLEQGNNPSDFPFLASIDEYWTLYDRVNALTAGNYPDNPGYQTMLRVIGISTTAEYLLKGAYENTIGRFTRWTASDETAEDLFIRQAHRAYGELIYSEPWYKFQFSSWAKRIWSETPFWGKNFIRKFERKLFFTLEFGFKSLYAKLIQYGAEATYEASTGQVILTVKAPEIDPSSIDSRIQVLKNLGENEYILSIPRWGDFSEIVPILSDAGFQFITIAGNDDILLTTISDNSVLNNIEGLQFLFNSRVMSPAQKKRSVYFVRVSDLNAALRKITQAQQKLEHIYDY